MPDDGPREADGTRRAARWSRLWLHVRTDPRWVNHDPVTGRWSMTLTVERAAVAAGVALSLMGFAGGIAALLGWFHVLAAATALAWAAGAVVVAALLARRRLKVAFDGFDWAAIGVASALALSAGLMHHVDFASTWDTGIYLQDAIVIGQTGARTLPGVWANWLSGFVGNPQEGFHAKATFGYPSLAAYFSHWFGWDAVWWANAPLTFTTTLCLYALARRLGARWGALGTGVLYGTSLLTIWFNRWTMSENAATMVFWASVALALPLTRRWDWPRGAGLFVCLLYGMLVRPEGFLVAGWFAVLLLVFHWRAVRQGLRARWRRREHAPRWAPLMVFSGMVVAAGATLALVVHNRQHQLEYVMSRLHILLQGRPLADGADVPTVGPHPNWGDYAFRYEWESALPYLVPVFLLIGLVGIWKRAIPRRAALTIAAFTLVYLVFVVMPPVTIHHPWYMRRLWVAFIPLSYLLSACTLDPRLVQGFVRKRSRTFSLRRKSWAAGGCAALLFLTLFQVQASAPLMAMREDDGIARTMERLAADLGPDPFVVFDPLHKLYSGPLRLVHGVRTHNLHIRDPGSTIGLFEEADRAQSLYVVRGAGPSFAQTELDAPQEIQVDTVTYPNAWTWFDRDRLNHRGYMDNPPLEFGYAPFTRYLDQNVPPRSMIQLNDSLDVLQVRAPLVLTRRCHFENGSWEMTPVGIQSAQADARVNITSKQEAHDFRGEFVYLVYPEPASGPMELLAEDRQGRRAPMVMVATEGSGPLRYAQLKFPADLDVASLLFPAGSVLRGVFVGGAPPEEYKGGPTS